VFNDGMEWMPVVVIAMVAFVLLVAESSGRAAANRQARRLAAVDRKLQLIMEHLGIRESESEPPAGVLQELSAGRKIQAIKVYRQATGVGLKDAKDAVDLLARRHGLQ
jgi:ribosomal protein L7/L12